MFSQSCVEVPATLSNVGGLAVRRSTRFCKPLLVCCCEFVLSLTLVSKINILYIILEKYIISHRPRWQKFWNHFPLFQWSWEQENESPSFWSTREESPGDQRGEVRGRWAWEWPRRWASVMREKPGIRRVFVLKAAHPGREQTNYNSFLDFNLSAAVVLQWTLCLLHVSFENIYQNGTRCALCYHHEDWELANRIFCNC